MIKLVIFDMDGLLIDSENAMWLPNELKVCQQMNMDIDQQFLRSLNGGSKDVSIKAFKQKYGESFDVDGWYQKLYQLNDISINNNQVPLKKGALELLNYLKENNIHICLGSSSRLEYIKKVLTNLKVIDYFENIVSIENVTKGKPNPDIYLYAKSLYPQFNKDEILVLEDAHNGLVASIGADLNCIIVPDIGILTDWDYQNDYDTCFDLLQVKELIDNVNN